jgi:hypothetical protein
MIIMDITAANIVFIRDSGGGQFQFDTSGNRMIFGAIVIVVTIG